MINDKMIDVQNFTYFDEETGTYTAGIEMNNIPSESMAENVAKILLNKIDIDIMQHSNRKN